MHKSWSIGYRQCAGDEKNKKNNVEALAACVKQVDDLIAFYGELSKANVYTSYADKEFSIEGGTFILFDRGASKILSYFGAWMPDGHMDAAKAKGFPYDGSSCDSEATLKKKGDSFVVGEGAGDFSDDFNIKISDKYLTVNGEINCGRDSIRGGKFNKR